jgi:small GTP-binding protein
MFTLLRGFYDEVTYVPERRVVMLGTLSAGKTALLECLKLHFPSTPTTTASTGKVGRPPDGVPGPPRLSADKLASIKPTVGLNVAKLSTGAERFLVWDLGGAKPLRPIWARYIADAEALIWVVDASDPTSFEESRTCLRELLDRPPLSHAPLLVYATKQDVHGALDPVRTSLALDILFDAELRPQCVHPTSAVTGIGVHEGLDWLIHRLRNPAGEIKTTIY